MRSSYSQQNDIMEQQNSRIAQIYERMLMGDRQALGNLQSVKIGMGRDGQGMKDGEEGLQSSTNLKKKLQNGINYANENNVIVESSQKKLNIPQYTRSPAHRIQTIQQELLQESLEPTSSSNLVRDQQQQHPAPNLHQPKKQNLRQFIKSKVTQLRNQKELIKSQQEEEMQLNEIKKITKNIRLNVSGQSKSYDLVRRKDVVMERGSVAGDGEQLSLKKKGPAKQRFESVNFRREQMKKTQSSVSHDTNKHLPPLYNQRRKAPTQNSQQNTQSNDSIYRSRHQIRTPISLANSNIIDISPKAATQKSHLQYQSAQPPLMNLISHHNKQDSEKLMLSKVVVHVHNCLNKNVNLNTNNNNKVRQSLRLRVPIQQIKKQRQQFITLNQREISMQLDIIEYHHRTKPLVEGVKAKYGLNFRNVDRLAEIKGVYLNPQPILNKSRAKSKDAAQEGIADKDKQHPQQNPPTMKKKRLFDKLQQKITSDKNDISLIDELISRKQLQMKTQQQTLSSNNQLMQYWAFHDLYTNDFEDENEQEQEEKQQQELNNNNVKDKDGHSTRSSNIRQAYSTSMPHTREKGWKTKAIKEYDTNRSFQEFAKSRGVMKDSKVTSGGNKVIGDRDAGLRRIEQDDEEENRQSYRVTVDPRLRGLLVE